ncbi:hypothetical protein GCM10028796_55840 [Ramlibacter monticola]
MTVRVVIPIVYSFGMTHPSCTRRVKRSDAPCKVQVKLAAVRFRTDRQSYIPADVVRQVAVRRSPNLPC